MKIIPALDIIEGKCVRLSQGDYSRKKIYSENPVDVAKSFEDSGFNRLHLVDLDGAKSGQVSNIRVLESIAGCTNLVIDFGGGIKLLQTLKDVFNAGAAMAAIGSIAVKNQTMFKEWLQEFGPKKFFLGADVKEEEIAISGWLEQTNLSVFDFVNEYMQLGVKNVFCTDISKDGLLQGPSSELYKKLLAEFPSLELTASGGVASINDLIILKEIGCAGAIVGKAIYEGNIGLNELKQLEDAV